jgi:hypothetical protein
MYFYQLVALNSNQYFLLKLHLYDSDWKLRLCMALQGNISIKYWIKKWTVGGCVGSCRFRDVNPVRKTVGNLGEDSHCYSRQTKLALHGHNSGWEGMQRPTLKGWWQQMYRNSPETFFNTIIWFLQYYISATKRNLRPNWSIALHNVVLSWN